MVYRWWLSAVFILVFSATFDGVADPLDPVQSIKALVQSINTHIMPQEQLRAPSSADKALYTKYRQENMKYHSALAKFIDFEKLATESMPAKWRSQYWSDRSKKKFIALLQDLIEEIVYPRAREFFEGVKVSYGNPVYLKDGKNVLLPSQVFLKDKKDKHVDVQYKLMKEGELWKLYDVNLEGEWWTESFESQFNHIITTKSYDELVQLMQKKLSNIEAGTSF